MATGGYQAPTMQQYVAENGITVVTYVGDIKTITDAEAVVTGEDRMLQGESYITQALLQMSPMDFGEKRHNLKQKKKPLKLWEAKTTILEPPTQFKYVFHAVMEQSENTVKNMKKLYKSILITAKKKYHIAVLVIPVLGTGRGGLNAADAVQAVVESIADRIRNRSLQKIYLLTLNKDIAEKLGSQCEYAFSSLYKPKRRGIQSIRMSFRKKKNKNKLSENDSPYRRSKDDLDIPRQRPSKGKKFYSAPNSRTQFQRKSARDINFDPARSPGKAEDRMERGGKVESSRRRSELEQAQLNYGVDYRDIKRRDDGPPRTTLDTAPLNHGINYGAEGGRAGYEEMGSGRNYDYGNDTSVDYERGHSQRPAYKNDNRGQAGHPWEPHSVSHHHTSKQAPNLMYPAHSANTWTGKDICAKTDEPRGAKLAKINTTVVATIETGEKVMGKRSDSRERRPQNHGLTSSRTTKDKKLGDTGLNGMTPMPPEETMLISFMEKDPVSKPIKQNSVPHQKKGRQQNRSGGYEGLTFTKEATAESSTLNQSISTSCPICIGPITDPKRLEKCGHVFCSTCIDESFKKCKPSCPSCGMMYGTITGTMPGGTMDVGFSGEQLPGYEECGTITITYQFDNGLQKACHPNPGHPYRGTIRIAYLPDCGEGRKVLKLLKVAFDRKLTFTIGRSVTTDENNVVTWNDIHHKTRTHGGAAKYGYPDPGYLSRVMEELATKGVTEESLESEV